MTIRYKLFLTMVAFSFFGAGCSEGDDKPAAASTKPQITFEKKPRTEAVRDAHGCVISDGYVWSAAKDSCIRLWESGTELVATNRSEFVVFAVESSDKTSAEIFVPGDSTLLLQGQGNGTYTNDSLSLIVNGNNYVLKQNGRAIYQTGMPAPEEEQQPVKRKRRRR